MESFIKLITEQLTIVGALEESVEDPLVATKRLFQVMPMKQLISFDIVIKQDIQSDKCSDLSTTRAILIFKIAESSPLIPPESNLSQTGLAAVNYIGQGFCEKRVECSLGEVKMFREEIQRIYD